MADYFETDNVTREYDSRLVRRILSYLKPYRFLAAAALVSLAVSTLGELYIPVLQQRVIDDAILARFLTLNLETYDRETAGLKPESISVAAELAGNRRALRIGNRLFIPQGRDTGISKTAEAELRARGVLETEAWYAFPLEPGGPAPAAMDHKPELFLRGEYAGAIRKADLDSLEPPERRAVRAADITAIKRAALIFCLVLVFVLIFTFVQTWTTNLMSQRVMKDMRLALFKKTASQSTAFLSRHPVGRIVTRLTGDVET
ncbi:MAG: ABC transporter ATP-binding protein, partial [Treponema sp.]|nr:ABC transporter ATP-binding protein [Treponema sp.]